MLPSPQADPKRRGGAAGFVLFVLVVAALLAYIFFPDQIREALGLDQASSSDQEVPVEDRTEALDNPPAKIGDRDRRETRDISVESPDAEPETHEAVQPEPEQARVYRNEDEARSLLAQAEDLYRGFEWANATKKAKRVLGGMDVSPRLKVQAAGLEVRVARIEPFLKTMMDIKSNKRSEVFARNFATHPSQIEYTNETTGKRARGVPLTDFASKIPYEGDDPVAFVSAQSGPVALIGVDDSAIAGKMTISNVVRFDPADEIEKARIELRRRQERVESDLLRDDPIAFYETARFAYQNRIDESVTLLLDRALELDPTLAVALREDQAKEQYQSLVANLKDGKKQRASSFMGILTRKYKDTKTYEQARAYYDGEYARAAEIALAEQRAREEARLAALKEKQAIAQKYDDKEAVKETAKKIEEVVSVPEPVVAVSHGKPDDLVEQALTSMRKANGMPPTVERDRQYIKALTYLRPARDQYMAMQKKTPGDSSLAMKLTDCMQLIYQCKKNIRQGGH